jgi:protein-L-isoaspartate(D-aspartate) O-methyltransferase
MSQMHCCRIVGSGYLTACFAMMVGPEGRAVGIEHIPEIVASSIENVQRSAAAPLLRDGSLSFHVTGMMTGLSVTC